jgi:type VI protein secretion system component VasK
MIKALWASVQGEPWAMVKLHLWLTIFWFIVAFPICIFLAESIPFLVFISVYAVVTGHWASWQAARVERKQEEDADVQEPLEEIQKLREELAQFRSELNGNKT